MLLAYQELSSRDMYFHQCSSSIVQKCLVDAHKAGKDFRVIVVDSRPKMEGLCGYVDCWLCVLRSLSSDAKNAVYSFTLQVESV